MTNYEVQIRMTTRRRWEAAAMRLFTFPNLAARAAERHAREVQIETRVVEMLSGKVIARFHSNGRMVHGR